VQMCFSANFLLILLFSITIDVETVKKGGRNHSLFLLNGMQTTPPSIDHTKIYQMKLTLDYWGIGLQPRLPQWSQSRRCKSA